MATSPVHALAYQVGRTLLIFIGPDDAAVTGRITLDAVCRNGVGQDVNTHAARSILDLIGGRTYSLQSALMHSSMNC